MVSSSVKLGGSASHIAVGRVAHGLMLLTAVSDEQAFEAIRAGVDALPSGTKMFLNSGEFYDKTWGVGNLQLLSRFYEKYPEYVEKTFLSVKGAMKPDGKGMIMPDSSMENLRRSVENCQKALGPKKSIDLYQPARIDSTIPLETIMSNLITLRDEGKFGHIGLSECKGSTLRKAYALHPGSVAAVEVEVSAWEYGQEQKDLIAAATELGVSVLAYSPLGQGLLTGKFNSAADLPEGDFRTRFDRFKDDNIKANMAIVEGLKAIAANRKPPITTGQLCIAWVASLGPTMIPLPGSSKATRTLENLEAGDVELTSEEIKAIEQVLVDHPVSGERYIGGPANAHLHLWG
ncbi:aldo/keto reductase [Lentinula aciculospora]|uniref:Aldo/keto reductase n=1 Tax=Lentinula aciculospora TaxID=153920 RepID=A0A9W9ALN5_9AGAR|nr:aldo/keto reductase [Lentinula aciculospora]